MSFSLPALRARLRRALPPVAATAVVAIGMGWVLLPAPLGYDPYFSLIWGRDIAHGHLPDYEALYTPVAHPLGVVVGALLSPLSDRAAVDVWQALVILSAGALCVGVFRLGRALFSWQVGAVAAAIVATRPRVLEYTATGVIDVPAAALIVWAAALEARSPRRGAPVLVLLAVAGLLRPEAWLLSVAYVLWLAPPLDWRRRAPMAALAVAAPLLWTLSDLVVTGDPFWSRAHGRVLVREQGLPTGIDAVFRDLPRHLGGLLRADVLALAAVGVVAGALLLRRRSILIGALIGMSGVSLVTVAVSGLPVIQRYALLLAILLAVFAAIAPLGWLSLPDEHPLRTRWRLVGACMLAVLVGLAPFVGGRIDDLDARLRTHARVEDGLVAFVQTPRVKAALHRCRPIYLPAGEFTAAVVYRSGASSSAFALLGANPAPAGLLIVTDPARTPTGLLLPLPDPVPVPAGYRRLAARGPWIVYTGCPYGSAP